MAIHEFAGRWAIVAAFSVSIISGALGAYQIWMHIRKWRQAKDDKIRLDTEEKAALRFDVQDCKDTVKEHSTAIHDLNTRVAHLEGSK